MDPIKINKGYFINKYLPNTFVKNMVKDAIQWGDNNQ